jgi:hypothetical protein
MKEEMTGKIEWGATYGELFVSKTHSEHGDDDGSIVKRPILMPPDGLQVEEPPTAWRFMQVSLPFSPESVEYFPERKRKITENAIREKMQELAWGGSPNANNPAKLREEAIRILKRNNITRTEAEKMLKDKEAEFKGELKRWYNNHELVTIVPPHGFKNLKPLKVWVKK